MTDAEGWVFVVMWGVVGGVMGAATVMLVMRWIWG